MSEVIRHNKLDILQNYLTDSETYFEKQGGSPFGTIRDDMNAVNNYLQDQAELIGLT